MKPTPSSREKARKFLKATAHLGVAQRCVLDAMTRLNRYRRDREALLLARAAVRPPDAGGAAVRKPQRG